MAKMSGGPNNNYEPPVSVEELRQAFDKFDVDKDGKINRDELKSVLTDLDPEISEAEIAKAFQVLFSDDQGKNFVDFTEFVQLFNVDDQRMKLSP